MAAEETVPLPGGYGIDGLRHVEAAVRPLNGDDEMWLAEETRHWKTPHRVTGLLSRCVRRMGDEPVTAQRIRALTLGDREALMLHLRRITFGDAFSALSRCPSCSERMDLDLSVKGLLTGSYPHAAPAYEFDLSGRMIRFRLPAGEDLEAAAVAPDPGAGGAAILRRCIFDSHEPLDEGIADAIGNRMAELDPQAVIRLNINCPGCKVRFESLFDPGGYLLAEIDLRRGNLLRDVHALAFHYHWSEESILSLSRHRRRQYLNLINEELQARYSQ